MKSTLENYTVWKAVITAVGIFLILIFVYFSFWSKEKDIRKYEHTIDSAQNKIDSLQGNLETLNVVIDSLEEEVHILTLRDSVLVKKIKYIRKENEKKIDSVNRYNVSELSKFFTERYK